jgi:hypothetical protein
MARQRRTYTNEFEIEAVKLVTQQRLFRRRGGPQPRHQ